MIKKSTLIFTLFVFTTLNLPTLLQAQAPAAATIENGYTITDKGYILYDSPDAEFANVIEVGPGKTYAEIHDIPTNMIVKNTLVKIFHRTDPYRTKVFVDVIATENEKVRFQGIPNQSGDLPVISWMNATPWGNTQDSVLASGSAFVVFGTWSNKPAWIDIVNLQIQDAPYAGVWAKGDHVSVKGCVLQNNANGVFFQAANQLLIEISTYMLIEGCKFEGNGTDGGWFHHNIYAQGMHSLIQFNTIGHLRTGAFGSSLKDRSSFTVIRYNKIETSARTLDLVEPEETEMILTADNNWDDVYVYGNLLLNKDLPVDGAGTSMIHYGYDNVPTYRREGTLYFHNNTVCIERSDAPWRVNLFDVNSTNSVVQCSNNIVTANGMEVFNIFRSNNTDNAGNVNFGPNYFYMQTTQNDWNLAEDSGAYFMSGETSIIEGNNPGFTDMAGEDFTLVANSACIGEGNDLMSAMGLSVDHNSVTTLTGTQRNDQADPSLGCFEYKTDPPSSVLELSNTLVQHKAYPNPFEQATNLSFSLPYGSEVRLTLFDASGRQVALLLDAYVPSGQMQQVAIDAEGLAGGMYYYQLQTEQAAHTGKLVLVR